MPAEPQLERSAQAVDEPPIEREVLRRSRRAADRDAALSAAMNGFTDPFMVPYVLALGATAFQVGLLSSARNLLLAVVQLGSAGAVRLAGSRRALVLWTAGLQVLTWLPIAFVSQLFGPNAVPALIALYTIGTSSAALGAPAWGSLVADYTPPAMRGRYFGRRARLSGASATTASIAAGAMLQASRTKLLGFSSLCVAAMFARSLSWLALSRFHDAGWKDEPHLRFSFFAFVRRMPHANFARFAACIAANSLAANVAAPFFAVYLLASGGYSYAQYTAVVLAGSVAGTMSSAAWGRVGDRVGNHAVLRLCMAGVVVLPALWMVSPHVAWMLPVNVLGAVLWGGFNLSATNFVYDAVSPGKRHTCIAYFNVLNGLGVSAGAFLGSFAVSHPMAFGADPLRAAFWVSVALRLASWFAFETFVREVRPIRQVGLREVMLDAVDQHLMAVLGLFSVEPEREKRRRLRRRGRRRREPRSGD